MSVAFQKWVTDDGDHASMAEVAERDGSGFHRENMARVLWWVDGDNDGPDWAALMEGTDGRFWFVWAWCDYTGWG